VAEEKKPGLLKRIFFFGVGKKKAEPEPEEVIEDNSAAEAEAKAIAEEAAQQEVERLAAIKQAEEDALEASRLAQEKEEAERVVKEEEAAKEAAEQTAREEKRLVAEKAEAERLAQEAEAKRLAEEEARLEAEREEAERIRQEELVAAEKAAQEVAEKAKIAAEKADAEEAARLELEAAKEVERLQAERKAAEEKQKQDEEEARLLAEKQAAEEASRKKEQEEAAAKAALEAEKREQERLEAERLAQEQAEAERLAAEEAAKLEAERLEAEQQAEVVLRQAQDEEFADPDEDEELTGQDEDAEVEDEDEVSDVPAVAIEDEPQPDEEEERKVGWFKRLTKGLARSSNALTENITSVFTKKKLDEDTLQELEDILIQADLGVETAMNITDTLASQRMGKDVTDEEVRQIMADEIEKVLEPVAQPLELDLDHQPHVILVVGVNGSGKTTTIGKISQKLYNAGFSTLLVAGDTFRAAAVEQLHIWGDRTQAPVMSRPNGSDAAGLAYDAYTEAVEQKRDVMLMDTAGRLQNKKELMDELEKIIRVLKKQDESAPHTVLLTLDATTGQNALNQVEIFKDVAGVNGLVMTKLDGTARGGILVSISAKHKLPVYFIGVGEQIEDLEPFEADVFAKTIAGIE